MNEKTSHSQREGRRHAAWQPAAVALVFLFVCLITYSVILLSKFTSSSISAAGTKESLKYAINIYHPTIVLAMEVFVCL